MMMKSPALKVLGQIVWIVTGLYALNALTMMHGYNLFGMGPLVAHKEMVAYFVGFCGLVSLISWGMHLTCHCEGNCACK